MCAAITVIKIKSYCGYSDATLLHFPMIHKYGYPILTHYNDASPLCHCMPHHRITGIRLVFSTHILLSVGIGR